MLLPVYYRNGAEVLPNPFENLLPVTDKVGVPIYTAVSQLSTALEIYPTPILYIEFVSTLYTVAIK